MPQSNELTNSKTFAYRGSYISARAMLYINLIWFGHIARRGEEGGGYFTRSNDFYLRSLRLEEGGSAPCAMHHAHYYY
jgi:hypothetical protein